MSRKQGIVEHLAGVLSAVVIVAWILMMAWCLWKTFVTGWDGPLPGQRGW